MTNHNDDDIEEIAHAMASAHARWASASEGKKFLGPIGERMLTHDEYRWMAVAALREQRKRAISRTR